MARDHGRIKTSIWRDPDWRDLPVDAQWLYKTIISQEALSRCGVLDWRPGRIAALASGNTARKVEASAKTLERARFVVIDRQTEELLVRTHVRHDGVLDRVNMGKAVGRALAKVVSQMIRDAALTELARVYEQSPRLAGWQGIEELFPDDMAAIRAMASTIPFPMASREA